MSIKIETLEQIKVRHTISTKLYDLIFESIKQGIDTEFLEWPVLDSIAAQFMVIAHQAPAPVVTSEDGSDN